MREKERDSLRETGKRGRGEKQRLIDREKREKQREGGDREKECRVEHAWERDTKVKDSLNPRHHSSAFRNYK